MKEKYVESGKLFRPKRKEAGYTQVALNKLLGYSKGYIHLVEKGFIPLPKDTMDLALSLIECSFGEYMEARLKDEGIQTGRGRRKKEEKPLFSLSFGDFLKIFKDDKIGG